MKRSSLAAVPVLVIVAVLCTVTATAEEVRAEAPKVATPKFSPPTAASPAGHDAIAEWEGIPLIYLSKGPRLTKFAHDDRYLYVHFHFGDPALARQIARTGVIVWVNGEDDHTPTLGLRYHGAPGMLKALGPGEGEDAAGPGGGERQAPLGEEHAPGASPGDLEMLRGGKIVKVVDGGVAPDGAGATSSIAGGAYAYEFRVPLASLVPEGAAVPKRIAVGFQMHGLTPSELAAEGTREESSSRRSDESLNDPMRGSGGGRAATVKAFLRLGGIIWVDVDLLDTPPPAHKP